MESNTQLDIDRRILRLIRAENEIAAAEIARRLIVRYSGVYTYNRLHYLEATGKITLDRSHGRRGMICRPCERIEAELTA